MTQEIIEMARHIASSHGTRMCDENGNTHGEELYAMGIDDIVDTIVLVAAKERERLAKVFDARDTGTGFYEPHEPAEIIRGEA